MAPLVSSALVSKVENETMSQMDRDEEKRDIPVVIQRLLRIDQACTAKFIKTIDSTLPLGISSFDSQLQFIGLTSNGFLWLPLSLLIVWLTNSKQSEELYVNLFTGLCLDVLFIALMKAYFRRRRPKRPHDEIIIGMDKFSFPSGHSSRSTYLVLFFYFASFPLKHGVFSLLPVAFLVLWALGVMLSRVVLERHYLLDIAGGVVVGFLVTISQRSIFWLGEESAHSWANWLKYDMVSDWSV